ncbi:MAG: alpha-glucosidase/alpha-galactosidase [Chloroflexota bacterium]|nr:alpha-glucosidase/alpha-galactosidase [Chloroflexota bacterium]
MPSAIRIAIVGAGSAQFSVGLVRDLCLTESLAGSTIAFVDTDVERLAMIHSLATRYVAELGADLRFEQFADREPALDSADVVVNTALAGGHQREEDERALLDRLGYYRGLHPSEGFYHQFNLMLSVARDIERICPNAWLIQSSNPVFDGCTLMTRETGVKVVGLCHGPFGGIREIVAALDLDPAKVGFAAPGVNHCVWMTEFRYEGQDAFPLLERWIDEESETFWSGAARRYSHTQLSPAAIHMYRLYGAMPLGDTSRAIWPEAWWYHQGLTGKQRWWGELGGFDSEIGWGRYLQDVRETIRRIAAVAGDPGARVTDIFPPNASGEQIVPIIDALFNDRRGHFIVNVPNRGAISRIAGDVVVEVPAVVDGGGIHPTIVGPLPDKVMLGAVAPQVLAMERRLAGFRSGDPSFIMQVVLSDQRTRSWDHAEEVVDALMRMPGNESMADHYGARHDEDQGTILNNSGMERVGDTRWSTK